MSLEKLISAKRPFWHTYNPPADKAFLAILRKRCGFDLPHEYFELLGLANGGEGELAIDPGWFQLWRAEEVIKHNKGYEVQRWHPGYFGFGSSGGGVMFAFKSDEARSGKVFGIPFDSIDPDDIDVVAEDFLTFAKALGRESARGKT